MAPNSWATYEQWQWLCDRKGACADARQRNRYGNWLTAVFHDWFARWPKREVLFEPNITDLTPEQEAQLATAIQARQAQLTNWFKNHRSRTRDSRGIPPAIVASLSKGKGRVPQAREVFCRMFYDKDKKTIVERDLHAERRNLGRKLNRREVLRITRARVDSMYEEASDDVKAQVDARLSQERAMRSVPPPNAEQSPTPQAYQNAIDAAPTLIERLLEPVSRQTGWCITVVAAGPSPENDGEINSFAVHFGHNQSGHTLPQAIDNFRDSYIRPMIRFARGVYSQETRESRALGPQNANLEDESNLPEAGPSSRPSTDPSSPRSSEEPVSLPTPLAATSVRSRSSSPMASTSSLSPASTSTSLQPSNILPSPGLEFPLNPMFDMNGNATSFPSMWPQNGASGDAFQTAFDLAGAGPYPIPDPFSGGFGMGWSNIPGADFPLQPSLVPDPLNFPNSIPTSWSAHGLALPSTPAPATSYSPSSSAASTWMFPSEGSTSALSSSSSAWTFPSVPVSPASSTASTAVSEPLSATLSTSVTASDPASPTSSSASTTVSEPTSLTAPAPVPELFASATPDATTGAVLRSLLGVEDISLGTAPSLQPVAPMSPLATLANIANGSPTASSRAPSSRRTATMAADVTLSSSRPQRIRKAPRRADDSPDAPRPSKRLRKDVA